MNKLAKIRAVCWHRIDLRQKHPQQRRIKADGYSTVQDWIADMVRDYNKEHDDEHT